LLLTLDFQDDGAYDDGGYFGGELKFELAVGVGEEYAFGGTDCELCEFEEVVESLDVGVEDGEGELGTFGHRAEA
jgi:hypothetical protein